MEVAVMIMLVLAALPLGLGIINMVLYRRLPAAASSSIAMSVLIPARNEEQRISPVLDALTASGKQNVEIIIADDNSTDRTAQIVQEYASRDTRIRLISVPALPQGWIGKNHACHTLAQAAKNPLCLFLDADVIIQPDTLDRIAGFMERNQRIKLLSGFPRLLTGTLGEKLLIPLIHFVLLGFLPFPGVRFTDQPMFATACGQLIAVDRQAYMDAGGHSAIRARIHEGDQLARLFRKAGHFTDLFDATDVAATRMYDNFPDLVKGLMKNAHEGMATPVGLPVWTVLLGGGQVLPIIVLAVAWLAGASAAVVNMAGLAVVLGYGFRFLCMLRFRQSLTGALLHPVGMTMLLGIQWIALVRWLKGHTVSWKDRSYGDQQG